jgi:RHS repeat-associated protein
MEMKLRLDLGFPMVVYGDRQVKQVLRTVSSFTVNGQTQRFIHDPVTGGVAQHENPSGAWHFLTQDGLGTVRHVYDTNLSEVYAVERDPYGEEIAHSGTNPTPYEYTGEMLDGNGLLHLRARYYDPASGVFTSLDLLETANRYGYVGGNPTNFVDPSGLDYQPPQPQTYGGCQVVSDCEASPIGEPHQVKKGYETVGGISLTVPCESEVLDNKDWVEYRQNKSKNFKQAVEIALATINARGSSNAFNDIEFLLFRDSGKTHAASVQNKSLVHWYAVQMNLDAGLSNTAIHELGHILSNRTDHLNEQSMRETGLTDRKRSFLPNRFLVGPAIGGDTDEFTEAIADFFYFWAIDVLDMSTTEKSIAYVYTEGGVVVENATGIGPRYPIIAVAPLSLFSNALVNWYQSRVDRGESFDIMYSPGVPFWLANASW